MNKFIFITFLLATALNACKPDKVEAPPVIEDKVDSYKIRYMHYNFGLFDQDTVQIKYSNGNIIKRVGGALETYSVKVFDPSIYEDVTYNMNQAIIIKSTTSSAYSFYPNERRFFYAGNKIEKCVIQKSGSTYFDTTNYFYNNESIVRQITIRGHLVSQADFYYNSNKNVDSIITRYAEYNPVTRAYEIDFSSLDRDKEVFENYDNYANPAKKLVIFEETFNRSLSANNYRKYSKFKYDKFGTTRYSQLISWTFVYENGKINFAK